MEKRPKGKIAAESSGRWNRDKYIIKNKQGLFYWRGSRFKSGWTDDIRRAYKFSTISGVTNRANKYPGCKVMKVRIDFTVTDENFTPIKIQ